MGFTWDATDRERMSDATEDERLFGYVPPEEKSGLIRRLFE
jgi:hypothetical protein